MFEKNPVIIFGGMDVKQKTESLVDYGRKEGVVRPPAMNNPLNSGPRSSRQAVYRSVAVKVPGNLSPMIVHVKEF